MTLVQIPNEPIGSFILEVELRGHGTEDVDKALIALLDHWLALGAFGAFCIPPVQPRQATMALEEFRRLTETVRQWRVAAEQSDPRCLRILRNVLVGFSLSVHPLERIRIDAPDSLGRSQPEPLEPVHIQTADRLYPEVTFELGFPVEWEPTGSPWSYRRLLVEFAAPPSDATVDAIVTLVDHWEWITMDGFPMKEEDLESGKCSIEDIETNLFDEYTVESVVAHFGGSEAAWNPLLNALGWFHRKVQPIVCVSIQ